MGRKSMLSTGKRSKGTRMKNGLKTQYYPAKILYFPYQNNNEIHI